MVEKINKTSNKKIVMVSALLMIIILIIGFTYAYWTRNFTQSGTNISKYKCFNVTYKENVEGITLENGYPISDEEGLQQEPYEVEIENTCETVASYNVVLNKMNTTTVKDEYIKIGMNEEVKKLSELNTIDSTLENASYGKILKTGVLGVKESTTISIRSWMDIETPEIEGANKIFENKITIESAAGNKQLAALILANNPINTSTPDFSSGEPTAKSYKETDPTEGNPNLNSTKAGNKALGSSYTFNKTTGRYTLVDTKTNQTYDESSIGKYTCNNTTSKCSTMYKINSVTDTTVNNVDTYTSKGNYNKLTKAILYESNKTSKIYSQSGMYKAEDDDGESYYFRGKIDNNYVSFANNLWRIVRINGDGSIRLILEGLTTKRSISMFYTRNNERICNSSNPCDNNVGIASPAKKNLQTWYENTLVTYDDKIVESRYCNDTSFVYSSDDRIYYGAYERLHDTNKPILKCPETQSTSGGAYKLKIGLLSADEANMAGLKPLFPYSMYAGTNYLIFESSAWTTMSLGSSTVSGTLFNIGFTGSIAGQYHNTSFLRPVINLKSDIQITSGDGSKSNPYVVE